MSDVFAGSGSRPLAQDHHVHSTFTDDATATIARTVTAARVRRLTHLCFADYVGRDCAWLPLYVRTVRAAARMAAPDLHIACGVETMILDGAGTLDLPQDLPPLDRILIADHEFPSRTGPVPDDQVRDDLVDGHRSPSGVIGALVDATVAAMSAVAALPQVGAAQLAHVFSLLPRVGLTEDDVSDEEIVVLAEAARETGTIVECNERWRGPGPRVLRAFERVGVPIVAGTGSRRAQDVGVYEFVAAAFGDANLARDAA